MAINCDQGARLMVLREGKEEGGNRKERGGREDRGRRLKEEGRKGG